MSALLTDLYELNMMQSYLEGGMTGTAVFEFFVRKLPQPRGFLMAAGLEQALDYLENLSATPEELQWLKDSGRFSGDFIAYMEKLRFSGDVHAMPEGTVFFPDEPILRITAPLPEAQLIESRIINLLHFQTVIASKAARMVLVSKGRRLIDFGLRRAHGAEAGLLAARAAYIAGFHGTATVEAQLRFGVPAYGTMAHSFIQAHDGESEAFERFARSRPDNLVLLLDTYDTEAAARKVVQLAPKLATQGITLSGVRLDSGDLIDHARKVRRILDDGGLANVRIFASGGIDEHKLLAHANVPIDGYGIGSALTVSQDAPVLDCGYKLQEYAGEARRKRSEGKATWPGRKQVYRYRDANGRIDHDVLTIEEDIRHDGEALLTAVMRAGKRIGPAPGLDEIRSYAAEQLDRLSPLLHRLGTHPPYPVEISDRLKTLAEEVDRRTRAD